MSKFGFKTVGFVVSAIVLAGAGVVAFQWKNLSAKVSLSEFRKAETDERRAELGRAMLDGDATSIQELLSIYRDGTAEQCATVSRLCVERCQSCEPGDATCRTLCEMILTNCDAYSDIGRSACQDLVLECLRLGGPETAGLCRKLVVANLSGTTEGKTKALRLATEPALNLRADVVPLLDDADAGVRQAAMTTVGPAGTGREVIGTEDLFRWLNDGDDGVRLLCEASLTTRGVESEQIEAGKKLTHPLASERLMLLSDIHSGQANFRDPGPWLERLSRDTEPAVRAAAVRVGYESHLQFATWLDGMTQDPDPTVRTIATYYKAAKTR